MRKFLVILAVCSMSSVVMAAVQQQIFSDDFESYADDAALDAAGAWGDPNAAVLANIAASTLIPSPSGNPGQALFHGGGVTVNHIIPTTPVITDANPLVFEYDYWDYQTGASDRMGMGVRNTTSTSAGGFFELSEYNSMDPDINTAGSTSVQGYGFRTVFVGGPGELQGWVAVTQTKTLGAWHHFKGIIGATYFQMSIDRNDDGSVDHVFKVPLTSGTGKTYNILRLGGAGGVSSTAGAGFDNVNAYIATPEPATLAVLALGSLFLRRRRA